MASFCGTLRFADGKRLTPQQLEYLLLFCCACPRHKWSVELLKDHPDPLREAVVSPLGEEGEYFVSSHEFEQLPEAQKARIIDLFCISLLDILYCYDL
jgi:hypothetical protein